MGTLASRPRRLGAALCLLLGVALGLAAVAAGPAPDAGAQSPACRKAGCLDVVAVNGLIDGVEADFIIDSLRAATPEAGVVGVLLQVDSGGVAVDPDRFEEVARAVRDAEVPVSAWVGPSGAEALGGAVYLVQLTKDSGIAPGSAIGDAGPQELDPAEFGELLTGPAGAARTKVLSARAAARAGVVDRFSPTVGDHIVGLDGVETRTVTADGQRRQEPITVVRFSKLPLLEQLFHTVASPSVAYLLLAAGLGLLLFEFFTAGVGVAGVVGAGCALLAAYGIAELPHSNWALALVLGGMVAFGIDVQTGIPRLWTIIGMTMFTLGSAFLFTEFRPTWIALLVGVVGMGVAMFSGMPAMVRTRFATPTIGREWMVGEMGSAATAVDPEGVVTVRGAPWRALTNRATPIAEGEVVRVVAIDGLVLEVEPEEGGAIDYREMRNRRKGDPS